MYDQDAVGNIVSETYIIPTIEVTPNPTPTETEKSSVSTLALILGLLSLASVITLVKRRK